MTIEELRERLNQLKVPGNYYCLVNNGRYAPDEKLCLMRRTDCWEVFYSERGGIFDLHVFDNESDACEYFLNMRDWSKPM